MDKTNGLPVQNGIDADVKDFRFVCFTLLIFGWGLWVSVLIQFYFDFLFSSLCVLFLRLGSSVGHTTKIVNYLARWNFLRAVSAWCFAKTIDFASVGGPIICRLIPLRAFHGSHISKSPGMGTSGLFPSVSRMIISGETLVSNGSLASLWHVRIDGKTGENLFHLSLISSL